MLFPRNQEPPSLAAKKISSCDGGMNLLRQAQEEIDRLQHEFAVLSAEAAQHNSAAPVVTMRPAAASRAWTSSAALEPSTAAPPQPTATPSSYVAAAYSSSSLNIALIGGPMYDSLYTDANVLSPLHRVVFKGDHDSLNAFVASAFSPTSDVRLDVIATHSKYAPSQAEHLLSLDDLIPKALIASLNPQAVALCRLDGKLYCVPRNIDTRLLWYRSDVLPSPPTSFDEILEKRIAYGFTGTGSGVFGLFYELVIQNKSSLFDERKRPTMDTPASVQAIETIVKLAANSGVDLASWKYDDSDAALAGGAVACASMWPGGHAVLQQSPYRDAFKPAAYPADKSYSGCHAWAIPKACGDVKRAVECIAALCTAHAAALDARGGSIPAHMDVFRSLPRTERVQLLSDTIAKKMITYPALSWFPELEAMGADVITECINRKETPQDAARRIQAKAMQLYKNEVCLFVVLYAPPVQNKNTYSPKRIITHAHSKACCCKKSSPRGDRKVICERCACGGRGARAPGDRPHVRCSQKVQTRAAKALFVHK